MGDVDPRIARILGKLELVRDKRIATFGSESHGYSLAPPLSEAAVAAFEAKLGVTLPDEYRLFVGQAGAAGAGPYYGLLSAERWGDALYADVEMPDYATKDCVWTPGMTRDEDTFEKIRGGMHEPFQGAITTADQGCAHYVMLVTTGPARGRIMYVSMDGGVPFFPDNPGFLSWYERWLDELLWGYEHFWFGTQMPGDEAALAAAAKTDNPHRLDALYALQQVKTLAPETCEVVALRVRDDDPKVRSAALHLAKKKGLVPAIESHVRAALTHPIAAVRQNAFEALVDSRLAWEDDARRLIGDPEIDVAHAAARALYTAKLLTEAELLACLASPNPEMRRDAFEWANTLCTTAIFDAVYAQPQATPIERFDRRLNALLAHVRQNAIDAPRRARVFTAVKDLLAATNGARLPYAVITGLRLFAPHEPEALELLIGLLRHPEAFHRWDAAAALGELGDADALMGLQAIVDDPAMPRADGCSTAWSVGVSAQKAIAKITESIAKRS